MSLNDNHVIAQRETIIEALCSSLHHRLPIHHNRLHNSLFLHTSLNTPSPPTLSISSHYNHTTHHISPDSPPTPQGGGLHLPKLPNRLQRPLLQRDLTTHHSRNLPHFPPKQRNLPPSFRTNAPRTHPFSPP